MSKKTFIILITIFSIIILGLFGSAYVISKKSGGEVTTTEVLNNFLPFGGGSERTVIDSFSSDGGQTNQLRDSLGFNNTENKVRLRKISTAEVSGATIFGKGASTTIRYIERATGHIYETAVERGNLIRVSNTTIPKTQESFFVNKGTGVIARYLRDDGVTIESFFMKISPKKGGDLSSENTFLTENLDQIVVSPNEKKIFSLNRSFGGGIGIVSNPNNSKKRQVLNSPFGEWLISWPTARKIILTTKPSARIPGFAYSLGVNNSSFKKILSNINGLTTLMSPDGKFILYNRSVIRNISLNLYNLKEKSSTRMSLDTLPEKCVWSDNGVDIYCGIPNIIPQGEYPDDWYQGLISFSDNIWRINTQTGFIELIETPELFDSQGIDIINPILSVDEKYLIFTNKKDSYLWLLDLSS